jgi:hypothetical protein
MMEMEFCNHARVAGTDPVGEKILLVAVPEEGQLEFLLLKQNKTNAVRAAHCRSRAAET